MFKDFSSSLIFAHHWLSNSSSCPSQQSLGWPCPLPSLYPAGSFFPSHLSSEISLIKTPGHPAQSSQPIPTHRLISSPAVTAHCLNCSLSPPPRTCFRGARTSRVLVPLRPETVPSKWQSLSWDQLKEWMKGRETRWGWGWSGEKAHTEGQRSQETKTQTHTARSSTMGRTGGQRQSWLLASPWFHPLVRTDSTSRCWIWSSILPLHQSPFSVLAKGFLSLATQRAWRQQSPLSSSFS